MNECMYRYKRIYKKDLSKDVTVTVYVLTTRVTRRSSLAICIQTPPIIDTL